jgi:hypothetical protein
VREFQFINSRIICEKDELREEYNRIADRITTAQTNYSNYLDALNEE